MGNIIFDPYNTRLITHNSHRIYYGVLNESSEIVPVDEKVKAQMDREGMIYTPPSADVIGTARVVTNSGIGWHRTSSRIFSITQ